MKNVLEYYTECFAAEKPKFLRVMRAVPADRADYRPHPKSNSAADLAWMLASELSDACKLVDHGRLDFVLPPTRPVAESIAAFEKNAAALEERLAKLDDAAWERKAQFAVDGNVAWEAPLGDMLFGFLFDAIPPRAALDVPPADGSESAVDLRSVGGRSRDVARGDIPAYGRAFGTNLGNIGWRI